MARINRVKMVVMVMMVILILRAMKITETMEHPMKAVCAAACPTAQFCSRLKTHLITVAFKDEIENRARREKRL
jgi:hypothetical protein